MKTLKKYNSFKFIEQTDKEDEEEKEIIFDKRVSAIIKDLRDSNFCNEEQRKKFLDLISSLHNSKDPRARYTFKRLGQVLSDIGDELLYYKKY